MGKVSGFRTKEMPVFTKSTEKGDKMKLFRVGAFTALALLATQQASAQSLHGVRAEANVGVDRFYSEGNHDNHVGWGAEVGADFDLGGFIVGPYGSFWNARMRTSLATDRALPIASRSKNGALAFAQAR